ncbi:4-diphosphocytidyl-2-C-methyl-D-erythritol kinase [Loigolactobacillus bifermentans DSM 20003]|uniref:4-diphosphocytidyl-2-C-methyl-D-erythritol kinase n=1 Tax=Loigolactobacillus bifermentans DSM 20003 TaxID=1423726 RepID=A0A0R1GP54_9LACO|nr:4-diphosphocytidyl-2-C-methyl-D-erythritol kinase [Loigolactobacillus bifermentans DSM 20003]
MGEIMVTITEKAPAKINLSLDARFQHTNGDHEWQMVMTSVDLADYVEITPRLDQQIRIRTTSGFLPVDQRNLAYQAARLLQRQYQVRQGAQITIKKQIPVAAGLGGGSSDAAAVLRGLNRLWRLERPLSELAHLGLQIDSDVPYCVYSRTAYVSGRGDEIELLPELPPFWVILAKPRVSVSTPSILRAIDYAKLTVHPAAAPLVTAIHQGDFQQMTQVMGNALEPITSKRHPEISNLKHRMLRFGAEVAQMSGSGPTVFGLCARASRAQHVYNSMRGFCKEVYLVRPLR